MTETDEDVGEESLREELGQIKQAMGLREEYPYWWRFWVVEGVGVGLMFPILQYGLREGFDLWIVALFLGVFAGHQLVLRKILSAYERPTTGVPSWNTWHYIIFAGVGALIVGLRPFYHQVEPAQQHALSLVTVGTILGIAYLYLGQLLRAYDIRDADCYAFYAGGVWILLLSALIPHVSRFQGWEFAVFGVGYAIYCLTAYAVLSRV